MASTEKLVDLVDFHAHILPNVDHGSKSLEMSLQQLMFASAFQVKRVIATPHFYPNTHLLGPFLKERQDSYQRLLSAVTTEMPNLRLGAEVLLCENLHKLAGLRELCVENTNTILIELPYNIDSFNLVKTVENLLDKDYVVVLAHAERYKPTYIDEFVCVGAKLQLNACAFTSWHFRKTRHRWMNSRKIVAIGSDIHVLDKKAYSDFSRARAKLKQYADFIEKYSDKYWI